MSKVTNVVVAGLGGQGVLKGTDILADVALRAGYDVKKSEIKGMSQRGGSVTGDVRFGDAGVQPDGAERRGGFPAGAGADAGRAATGTCCGPGGVLITPDAVNVEPVAEQEDPERGAAGRAERAPADSRRAVAGSLARRLRRDLL